MKTRKNLYVSSAPYYDVAVDKNVFSRSARFISQLLSKFNVTSVLELGCGTGLYLIPLKKYGFNIEGLDLSENMLKEARKKSKSIVLYLKDMSSFKMNKKYDAILCLSSSLLALPNFRRIEKTIRNAYTHLNQEGILMLDLPNHPKEIQESNKVQEQESHKIVGGILNSTFYTHKKGRRWIEEWHGVVQKGNKTYTFNDTFEELIYSPKKLESSLGKTGFKILKIYGSRAGGEFNTAKSYRRFYVCQKK